MYTYGCTGKGGGGGDRKKRDGHCKNQEGTQASGCSRQAPVRCTGAACLTRRRTQDQAGTARTQEGNRASGVGMHLAVSW